MDVTAYKHHSQSVISIVPFFSGEAALAVSSAEAIRLLLGNEIKNGVEKPKDLAVILM